MFFTGISTSGMRAQIPVYDFEAFEHLLQKDNDTTYVINFWATWCVPCVKELPDFEKVNATYKHEKFKMILVNLDFRRDLERRVLPFIDNHGLNSKVVMLSDPNSNEWIPKVNLSWTGAIPATVIYNASKKYYSFHEGSYTYDELNNIVKPLITN